MTRTISSADNICFNPLRLQKMGCWQRAGQQSAATPRQKIVNDPYAQIATMCRSGQWLHDFSYGHGLEGPATSSHSLVRQEYSHCSVPASIDPCAVRRPRSSRDRASTRNSREAPQTLASSRADRNRRRHGFDDYCRERQLAAEITNCVASPRVRENYVEVQLTALGPEPRNSSITALERFSSAHSCDLCIGVES